MASLTRRALVGPILIASVGGLQTAASASGSTGCPPPGGDPAYDLSVVALTGPQGADVALTVAPVDGSGCVEPDAFKEVQLKV